MPLKNTIALHVSRHRFAFPHPGEMKLTL